MVTSRLLLACLVAAVVLAGCSEGGGPDRAAAPAAAGASGPTGATGATGAAVPPLAARVRSHLGAFDRIAARNDDTRAAGTPGGAASEDHVERVLRAAGYRVRRQAVRFDQFVERRPPVLRAGARTFRAPREVRTLGFSAAGEVTGRVRAVGRLGCAAADHRGLRRGEVALVTRGTCTLAAKARLAERAGAAAVLVANTPAARSGGTGTFRGTLGRPGVDVPVLGVAAATGRAVRGRTVRLRVDAVGGRLRAENVIGELPGGEPGRVVMAGAHLDSVAEGPGLNDNASGSAAVLALAERVAAQPRRPGEATFRVGFWAAEELGLIGSRAYVRGLGREERDAIRAYVNLDMVGSPNGAPFVYDAGGPIEEALREGVRATGRTPEETDLGGASDHASFRRAGIPIGGVYSGSGERKTAAVARRAGGTAGRAYDPCYHRACDVRATLDEPLAIDLAAATEQAVRALR